MLRTVARVEERPWLLLGLVFLATCFFGFLIQAGGTVWLRLHADPIAANYRTTLSYTSAIVGDAILLPVVNVFIVSQLVVWRRRPRGHEIAGAMVASAAITVFANPDSRRDDVATGNATAASLAQAAESLFPGLAAQTSQSKIRAALDAALVDQVLMPVVDGQRLADNGD